MNRSRWRKILKMVLFAMCALSSFLLIIVFFFSLLWQYFDWLLADMFDSLVRIGLTEPIVYVVTIISFAIFFISYNLNEKL